jgi:hypothetical protein
LRHWFEVGAECLVTRARQTLRSAKKINCSACQRNRLDPRQFIRLEIRFVKMCFSPGARFDRLLLGEVPNMRFSQRKAVPQLRACLLLATGLAFAGDTDTQAPFPAEYRQWAVTKSLVLGPEHKSFAINGGCLPAKTAQKAPPLRSVRHASPAIASAKTMTSSSAKSGTDSEDLL